MIMKFILVNHRTPSSSSICIECHRPLEVGYLRDMSTREPYCGYDCYLCNREKGLCVPWLAIRYGVRRLARDYFTHIETVVSFAAATCWYSIALTEAALRLGEMALLKRPHT